MAIPRLAVKGFIILLAISGILIFFNTFSMKNTSNAERNFMIESAEEANKLRLKRLNYGCDRKVFTKSLKLESYSKEIEEKPKATPIPDYNICSKINCTIYVQEKFQFEFCNIPGVASSYLMTLMLKLYHGVNFQVRDRDIQALSDELPKVASRPQKNKKKNNFSFLFVRHPFERLVSAYKELFENCEKSPSLGYCNSIPYIEIGIGKKKSVGFLSFEEYIEFLMRSSIYERDQNWHSYKKMCLPCLRKYDFIGKLETFERDMKYIANMTGLTDLISFIPRYSIKTTKEDAKFYFSFLKKENIFALYEIFEADFLLFGYDYLEYYDVGY